MQNILICGIIKCKTTDFFRLLDIRLVLLKDRLENKMENGMENRIEKWNRKWDRK